MPSPLEATGGTGDTLKYPKADFGQMTINFRGPWRSFPYLSVADLLAEPQPKLQGAFIFSAEMRFILATKTQYFPRLREC